MAAIKKSDVVNRTGGIETTDGRTLFGMDAEIYLKVSFIILNIFFKRRPEDSLFLDCAIFIPQGPLCFLPRPSLVPLFVSRSSHSFSLIYSMFN